jgi:hypothetical protein
MEKRERAQNTYAEGGEGVVSDLLQTLGICTVFALQRGGGGVKNFEKLRTYFMHAPKA